MTLSVETDHIAASQHDRSCLSHASFPAPFRCSWSGGLGDSTYRSLRRSSTAAGRGCGLGRRCRLAATGDGQQQGLWRRLAMRPSRAGLRSRACLASAPPQGKAVLQCFHQADDLRRLRSWPLLEQLPLDLRFDQFAQCILGSDHGSSPGRSRSRLHAARKPLCQRRIAEE